MTARIERDEPVAEWSSGITLKRTRDGYTWTIAVAADGNSSDDLREAIATAVELDDELDRRYPPPRTWHDEEAER